MSVARWAWDEIGTLGKGYVEQYLSFIVTSISEIFLANSLNTSQGLSLFWCRLMTLNPHNFQWVLYWDLTLAQNDCDLTWGACASQGERRTACNIISPFYLREMSISALSRANRAAEYEAAERGENMEARMPPFPHSVLKIGLGWKKTATTINWCIAFCRR